MPRSNLLSRLIARPELGLSATQRALLRMRFCGYLGVQWISLLIPIMLYQLTGDMALVGLIVIAEWAPKVLVYAFGGSIASHWGGSNVHKSLEVMRLLAMAILLGCTLGYGGVGLIVGVSVLCQCTNAVSNVLFERGVSNNWPAQNRALGHMLHMRQDYAACFVALAAGLILDSAIVVVGIALLCQLAAVVQAIKLAPTVHPSHKSASHNLGGQIKADFKAVCQRPLIQAWLYYIASSVPFAAVNSFVVFMLGAGKPAASVGIAATASVLLARAGASLMATQWAVPRLMKTGSERKMAKWSFLAACAFFVLLLVPGVMWLSAIGITGVAICNLLRMPYLRTTRQALITHHITEKSSWPGATGLFASGEAMPYLVAGGLASLLRGDLPLLMISCSLIGAWGTWQFFRHEKATLHARAE